MRPARAVSTWERKTATFTAMVNPEGEQDELYLYSLFIRHKNFGRIDGHCQAYGQHTSTLTKAPFQRHNELPTICLACRRVSLVMKRSTHYPVIAEV
jgi:hypothetical protein